MRPREVDAGFTLIEVLVALALFALISGTGFAILDQVLRAQSSTEGRLDRLAGLQRAMYVVTGDFLQARGGSFTYESTETEAIVRLRRNAPDLAQGTARLSYRLHDGVLLRVVQQNAGPPVAEQPLVDGIVTAEWRFFEPESGWLNDWPPLGQLPGSVPPNPRAVELRLTLTDGAALRRLVVLPRDGD